MFVGSDQTPLILFKIYKSNPPSPPGLSEAKIMVFPATIPMP
jgi:hypothetical protein